MPSSLFPKHLATVDVALCLLRKSKAEVLFGKESLGWAVPISISVVGEGGRM